MTDAARSRWAYEQAARALRAEADGLLATGGAERDVAEYVVGRRNALKAEFRRDLDPQILALIEARNLARYGDPVGPTLEALFQRYGDWLGVIDAACRPADLSGKGLSGNLRS